MWKIGTQSAYCFNTFWASGALSMGHTPSTAGTFRKKFRKNSGKTPETLSERFLEFPSRVRLGSPKPYNSRHLRLPEHFQNSLPPQYGWGRLFFQKWFRRGPLRAGHGIPSSTGGISDSNHRIVSNENPTDLVLTGTRCNGAQDPRNVSTDGEMRG